MTLSELKALHEANGGYFFSRDTMRFFGDTMRNLGIGKGDQPGTVKVWRRRAGKPHVSTRTTWTFSTDNGRVIHTNLGQ